MRWFLTIATAMIITCATTAESKADQYRRCYRCGQVRVVKRNKNIFQQLWELEKRKNAWLKRTFLGS